MTAPEPAQVTAREIVERMLAHGYHGTDEWEFEIIVALQARDDRIATLERERDVARTERDAMAEFLHDELEAGQARLAALTAALAKHHRAEGYDKAPLLDPRCVICGLDTARDS